MFERAAVLSPLRVPDYRWLWLAQTVSIVGDKIDQIAMSIVVFRITNSPLQMGVMLAVTMLPSAFFGLAVAPLVDRFDRRRTMIWSDVIRAVVVALIPFAAGLTQVSPSVRVGLIYVLAFLVATVSLFFESSRLALVPEIVREDQLMAANSLDSTTTAIAELAGIAVGATMVIAIGYRLAFAMDAASFALSAVFIFMVRSRRSARTAAPLALGRMRDDLIAGFRHIADRPVLKELVGLYGVGALGASASITLCFVLALTGFRGEIAGDGYRLAVVDTAITVGLAVGGVLVGMSGSRRAGAKFLGGLLAFGALFAATALTRSIWIAAAILFAAGIANMWFQIPMVTLVQQATDEDFRGRVFALRSALVRVVGVAGLLGAGVLAERVGVFPAIAMAGGLVFAVGLVGLTRPALRGA